MEKLRNKIITVHSKISSVHQQLTRNDKGATMIEYALVVGAIVAVAAVVFGVGGGGGTLTNAIQAALDNVVDQLTPAP